MPHLDFYPFGDFGSSPHWTDLNLNYDKSLTEIRFSLRAISIVGIWGKGKKEKESDW